ncbi:MAG: septum site-determining protein MinC [Geminicoccaceae bacterium]
MATVAPQKTLVENRQAPFQVRGSLQTVLSLRLLEPDDPNFIPLLVDKIAHSPDFFRNAPIVLDVGAIVARAPLDLALLVEHLRQHRLTPVGIQNGNDDWNELALAAGLAVFGAGSPQRAPASEAAPTRPSPVATPPRPQPTKVVSEPVRGGQQIVTQGDLVVLAPVSAGAELAASGHIHVYGTLRGRAFAGIGGDESAMIFCDQLEAELLSIAGVHLVAEEIDQKHQRRRARVELLNEQLVIHTLS